MVALERLDSDGVWELFYRTDKLGVLTVSLNADPSGDPNLQAAAIDLKNRFRELQRRIAAESEHSDKTVAALERLWPRVAELADPAAGGRSRILFAGLEDDWVLQLQSALPIASRVVLDDRPFIHPLLELLDEGRPAGVVLVSAEDAVLLEWRVGSVQQLSRIEQQYVEASHERAGHIGGGPQGQFHTPMQEQRQSREHDRAQRFLDRVTTVAAGLAAERGWERILVSGGDRWTEPAVTKFPQVLRDRVFADTRVLSGLDAAALQAAVTEWAHEQHAERERRLLDGVCDGAGSGHRVALGLSEVAAALNAGRVAHLIYDPEVRYTGTLGADGALYAGEEVGPDGHPGTPDSRLTERLVERAFKTGARISPIQGAADGRLRDAAGVAALLRW
ncbi:hypothetical protein MTER_36040 [Mycolicibacter terrae]|uniref:Uncharacterized protein n=1 Tax=Mycolicibacter terrae TaxID=1788 RepID=A0AAD1MI64_9MYCO|nr:hypothetical protein [Mycolicibacter terrae]ORW93675.1 hypothetical protein AWC28_16555 [Mycolicibacter terrae]BBX24193.1 hypothetical protein MTER_36040 [Mycolicibacter terrae]SNV55524.1 Uncharacterised protein [Mycolicibacter terrae]